MDNIFKKKRRLVNKAAANTLYVDGESYRPTYDVDETEEEPVDCPAVQGYKQLFKRPAAAKKMKKMKKKAKTMKKAATGAGTPLKKVKKAGSDDKVTPEKVYKSSKRHRVYSTAYKAAKKLLQDEGAINTDVCQQAAKDAVKKFLETTGSTE